MLGRDDTVEGILTVGGRIPDWEVVSDVLRMLEDREGGGERIA